jgi:cyclophilin family peptidyl-prolyl cis-trans isomerase
MNTSFNRLLLLLFIFILSSCKTPGSSDTVYAEIKTSAGTITVRLYNETPLHRDNFIKLIKSGFYEGILFHRVIKDFMIQAGDPETKQNGITVPDSLKNYTIPAEFNPVLFHKKGALAAARQGNEINPYMRSSGSQFYIVQGKKYSDEELAAAELRINNQIKQGKFNIFMKETSDSLKATSTAFSDALVQEIASTKMFSYLTNTPEFKFSEEQKNIYKNVGGTPRLDATYTVFGEVTEGLEIVDKIASEKTDASDKPLNNIVILKTRIIRK